MSSRTFVRTSIAAVAAGSCLVAVGLAPDADASFVTPPVDDLDGILASRGMDPEVYEQSRAELLDAGLEVCLGQDASSDVGNGRVPTVGEVSWPVSSEAEFRRRFGFGHSELLRRFLDRKQPGQDLEGDVEPEDMARCSEQAVAGVDGLEELQALEARFEEAVRPVVLEATDDAVIERDWVACMHQEGFAFDGFADMDAAIGTRINDVLGSPIGDDDRGTSQETLRALDALLELETSVAPPHHDCLTGGAFVDGRSRVLAQQRAAAVDRLAADERSLIDDIVRLRRGIIEQAGR